MASSLLLLLDDIATVLDDVAMMTKVAAKKSAVIADDVGVMTKVAAQKTAGVLGDDLALNAQQVSGVRAERELPVVWAVAKGSLVNKAILVPAALGISAVAPWAITPLLMVGGAYLCYEGFEKLAHKFLHGRAGQATQHSQLAQALADESVDPVPQQAANAGRHAPLDARSGVADLAHTAGIGGEPRLATNADDGTAIPHLEPEATLAQLEQDKIKGAVRTDFILSAEIIVIALGTVAAQPFATQVAVLVGIALLMTVGVYGLVGGIVKLDDLGLYLSRQAGRTAQALGRGILRMAPYLMKTLSIVGTAAMFLVGGGILVHGWHALYAWTQGLGSIPAIGWLLPTLVNALVGVAAGGLVLAAVTLGQRLLGKKSGHAG